MTHKELEYRYGCRDAPMTKEEYDELKEHKCCGCPFGKFTGTGYFCMMPMCKKDTR